jgi:hypothetical protein
MPHNAMHCIPHSNLIKEIRVVVEFRLEMCRDGTCSDLFSSKVVPKAFSLVDKEFLLLVGSREILYGSWSESELGEILKSCKMVSGDESGLFLSTRLPHDLLSLIQDKYYEPDSMEMVIPHLHLDAHGPIGLKSNTRGCNIQHERRNFYSFQANQLTITQRCEMS